MLRTSTILFVHSLPLSYPTCPQSLWCLHFLSLPIRSHFVSGECASEASGSQEAARHCVQKVKLDQRFGPVLVKDGECIRFPGLILPCPTFHFSLPVFLVRLQRPQPVQTAELHMWYVALSQYSVWLHVFGLFLALRHATQNLSMKRWSEVSVLLGFVWRQVFCRQRLKSNISLECTTQGDFYVTTPVYFSIIITFTVTLKCFKCNFNLSLKKVICFLRLLPVCQYFINC